MESLFAKKIGDSTHEKNLLLSRFEFTFAVLNFGLLKEPGGIINSPVFEDTRYGDKWRVQFAHRSHDTTNVTLQLVHSESKEEIGTTFQICIVDGSENIKSAGEYFETILYSGYVQNQVFLEGRESQGQAHQTFCISAILNPGNGYLVNGSVSFYVQILTSRLITESLSESEPESKNLLLPTEQLKSFLLSESFADVSLTSRNSQFPASKIILAAQSPVFLAMFNSEMRESESNAVVKIEDFSDEIIKGFLEFVYTGETESLEENAGELLKISDKYQVMSLKGKCERILIKNLKIENAVDILVLAHLHSPEKLKPKIISFVNNHFKKLKSTESFQRVKKEYPQLIFDLYEASMD